MTRLSLIALLAIAAVGACVPSEEEQSAEIKKALPDGCEMKDLGSYKEIDRLVVVICASQSTVSTTATNIHRIGKIRSEDISTAVVFGSADQ